MTKENTITDSFISVFLFQLYLQKDARKEKKVMRVQNYILNHLKTLRGLPQLMASKPINSLKVKTEQ